MLNMGVRGGAGVLRPTARAVGMVRLWPEQDILRIDRHAGGAKDGRGVVPVPPVPRCNECASPDAVTRVPCDPLIGIILVGIAHERHRPAGSYHPSLDVLAIDLEGGQRSTIAVEASDMTGPWGCARMLYKLITGRHTAIPFLSGGVETELEGMPSRRILVPSISTV
jgi:hypothetical protein